jgi:hypothetical protein
MSEADGPILSDFGFDSTPLDLLPRLSSTWKLEVAEEEFTLSSQQLAVQAGEWRENLDCQPVTIIFLPMFTFNVA